VKAYVGLCVLAVLFQVSTPKGTAQNGVSDPFPLVRDGYVPDRPQRPLVPATVPNPRFPLQAQILNGNWKYNGNHEYKGSGTVVLLGQTNETLSYKYRCVNSFRGSGLTYQARWVKAGQKLEILMDKPNSRGTRACRLSTRS
jgi:hypothetical protein